MECILAMRFLFTSTSRWSNNFINVIYRKSFRLNRAGVLCTSCLVARAYVNELESLWSHNKLLKALKNSPRDAPTDNRMFISTLNRNNFPQWKKRLRMKGTKKVFHPRSTLSTMPLYNRSTNTRRSSLSYLHYQLRQTVYNRIIVKYNIIICLPWKGKDRRQQSSSSESKDVASESSDDVGDLGHKFSLVVCQDDLTWGEKSFLIFQGTL